MDRQFTHRVFAYEEHGLMISKLQLKITHDWYEVFSSRIFSGTEDQSTASAPSVGQPWRTENPGDRSHAKAGIS